MVGYHFGRWDRDGRPGAFRAGKSMRAALSASADERTVAGFHAFGRDFDVAFRPVDDVPGIWGDPEATGKPAGNDLARRKRSLPVIAPSLTEFFELISARLELGSVLVDPCTGAVSLCTPAGSSDLVESLMR